MGNADFEIIEHGFDVPFRTRNIHAEYVHVQAGNLDVYVRPAVASRARESAVDALPQETGGLLAGRILRDDHGHYVVVTGMVSAPPDAGGLSTFNLSPEETEKLRHALSEHYPSADVIGWWHSHAAPSSYSGTDRSNQAMWTDPRHIGLLVFAKGTPWASVYVGPRCQGPFRPAEPARVMAGAGNEGSPHRHVSPKEVTWRPGPLIARGAGVRVSTVAILGIALIALLLGALGAKEFLPGPVERYIAWSCVVASSGTTATCRADSEGTVRWFLDGKKVGHRPTATFRLNTKGSRLVRVVVQNAAGTYEDEQDLPSTAGSGVR